MAGGSGVLGGPVADSLGWRVHGKVIDTAPIVGGVDGGEHLVLQWRAAPGQLSVNMDS